MGDSPLARRVPQPGPAGETPSSPGRGERCSTWLGGYPIQTWTGGTPDWGAPHPYQGVSPSDLAWGTTPSLQGGTPARSDRGYPLPGMGYPHQTCPGGVFQSGLTGGTPHQGWGTPQQGYLPVDVVLDTPHLVCLLCLRRRTFLLSINFFPLTF